MSWKMFRVESRSTRNHQPPTANYQLFHAVVRRFLRNLHVVHVALARAGRRDANQLRLPLQLANGRAAAVAHAGAETADELMNHRGDAPFVRDAPFDPLRHELVAGAPAFEIEFVLEIAVAAAAAHRANRPHAAVLLVAAPLEEDQLAGAFVRAGE